MLSGRLRYLASFGGKIVGTFVIAAIFLLTSCGSSGGYLPNNNALRPLSSAPSISAITPASGPTSGGTAVTITASNLQSGAKVTFAGVTAASVTYAHTLQPTDVFHRSPANGSGMEGTLTSIGRLTAVTPPGNAGKADVVVINPDGQFATRPYGFTYTTPPPSISSVTPSSGSANGGTALDPGTPLVALSTSVVAPGTPTVSNVFPDSCVSVGRCPVTLTGTNFVNGMTVSFGGVPATSVTVSSTTQLTAVVPPGTAGQSVPVVVSTSPTESATWSGSFRYGKLFVSDNFSSGDFSSWSAVSGQTDLVGDHTGTPLNVVTAGQSTYSGTTSPKPPNGETQEAQIWYPYRQGTINTSGTAVTLVSGDPFNPFWSPGTSAHIFIGAYKGVVDTSGTAVTLVSGDSFATDGSWAGKVIRIHEVNYTVSSVTDATHLTLTSTAGTQTGTWYLGLYYPISSCSSSTSCTLSTSAGTQSGVAYSLGSDDWNRSVQFNFSTPHPARLFVHGYVYFQAPTSGGPYGQRKLFYVNPGSSGIGGEILSTWVSSGIPGNPLEGTVNTSGTSVTWASGDNFPTDGSWSGKNICINGDCAYTVSSVADSHDLTLSGTGAGSQSGVPYASTLGAIKLNTISLDPSGNTSMLYGTNFFNFNQWYEIEWEIDLNNSLQKVWIDGVLQTDVTLTTTYQPTSLEYITIGDQLDGQAWSNEYRYWSDVAIGDAYIGP